MNSVIDEKQIYSLLNKHFGYKQLRSGQLDIISALARGESAAAIFPTGSGKSLCYQLPALFLPHLTLVISPLLALMKDQINFLNAHHIAAASIDSTQTHEQSSQIMQEVKNGSIKILMISVERFKNERFREFIKRVPISLMVIDEAHCISEWGHNFRPDYIKLPGYQKQFEIPQVLLLTATATKQVIKDMSSAFTIKPNNVISTGFYRKNLQLSVIPCDSEEKINYLTRYLSSHSQESVIIYVTLQKTAEKICYQLIQNGIHAEAYHAGLASDKRENIQNRFMDSQCHCIVATIAFGMGIDKNDIRHIIHYDLPKSIENYAQEIGRSGRDGKNSSCLLLANFNGLNTLENFVYGDTPEFSSIKMLLLEIQNATNPHTGQWEMLEYPLAAQTNIRLLPLKTLLVYLETEGILQSKYSYYADYKFKFLITQEQLLQKFSGERRTFVEAIIKFSKKAITWITVDIDNISHSYKAERHRIIAALEYFHEKQWINLESRQMTEVYQLMDPQFDVEQVSKKLYRHFKNKEQAEIKRIQDMLLLFQSEQCLSRQLAEYFSDKSLSSNCGHCSVCLDNFHPWPQKEAIPVIKEEQLKEAGSILTKAIMEKYSQPASSDLICRYLCGISTPWLIKVKAKKLGHFAAYEAYGYAQIYALLNKQ